MRQLDRRTRTWSLACVAAALAAACAVLWAPAVADGSTTLNGPGSIRITDRLVKHTHVTVSREGAGNLDFYRQALLNTRITTHPIGHSDVMCTNTGTGSLNCSGTYFLPDGKIMVSGVIASRLFYELAVVGGTGLYDNVRGTLTATFLGGSPAEEFLLFRLTV
jgi:hypothetical protein